MKFKDFNFERPVKEIKKELQNAQAYDVAVLYMESSKSEKKKIMPLLSLEEGVKVFVELDDNYKKNFFNNINPKLQGNFINMLQTDELKYFIASSKKEDKEKIFKFLNNEKRKLIKKLLSYDEEEAASIMTTEYLKVNINMKAGEATNYVFTQVKNNDFIDLIYVINENDILLGVIDLRDLIIARKDDPLKDIMIKNYHSIKSNKSISDAITVVKSYDLNAIPVLGDDMKLLGIITADDILEEMYEDIQYAYNRLGFLRHHKPEDGALKRALLRSPWSILTVIINVIFLSVLKVFDNVISEIKVLVLFQSIILAMSGNIGTQSLATTILAMDDKKEIKDTFKKEIIIGLVNSLIVAIIGFAISFGIMAIFKTTHLPGKNLDYMCMVAGVFTLSLFIAMFIGAFLGASLPVLLNRMGFNPGDAAGPLITTVNDIISLTLYFTIAKAILFHI